MGSLPRNSVTAPGLVAAAPVATGLSAVCHTQPWMGLLPLAAEAVR